MQSDFLALLGAFKLVVVTVLLILICQGFLLQGFVNKHALSVFVCGFRVNLDVRSCDIFLAGFVYCLKVSLFFCFLCLTSSVSLTASYADDNPAFLLQINCHSALSSSCDWLRAQGAAKLILASGSID